MSQLRLNPLAGRWVTVTGDRASRPAAFDDRALPVEAEPDRPCPFCAGNEEATPPALETYGPSGQWLVRVVPNLYPAFYGSDPLAVTHLGPVFTQAPASGIHEVLVLSPDHDGSWADLDGEQVNLAMGALRDRIEAHAGVEGVRYSQAIVNHGREAGASIAHPHGQLLGIPFVPRDITEEEAGFARFVGGCLMCTTLEAEVEAGHRTVLEDDAAVVVCPFWSGTPFELLVIPRSHEAHLDRAKPVDVNGVGQALRTILGRLRDRVGDVAYNIVFHTSPHGHEGQFHWHAHVLPKLTTRAGFELGTGVLINIVPPEVAAAELRGDPGVARITVSTTIAAPPRAVWAEVRDIAGHVAWMADAEAIRFTSRRRRGVGTAFECDTRVGPLTLTDQMVVTSWVERREIGVRHTGVVTGTGRFTLRRARGGRTRFTWQERLTFPWWLGGPVGGVVGAPVLRWVWRRNLRRLRARFAPGEPISPPAPPRR